VTGWELLGLMVAAVALVDGTAFPLACLLGRWIDWPDDGLDDDLEGL
jgi:hypothetical protein